MCAKEADKFISANILEGMTSISALLKAIESGNSTNDRKIIKILYNEERFKKHYKQLSFLKKMSEIHSFTLENVPIETIEENTIGNTHGGVIAICSERHIKELEDVDISPSGVYFMLEGIEDPYNFGYSLRSLYASGVNGIILSPRNWMSAAGVVSRASAGASELLDIYTSEVEDAVRIFKSKGYKIYCADKPNSVSIYETDLKKPLLMVIGGEKRGNSKAILDSADKILHIDYGRDFGAALSAASASTVISFEIMRQNK